MKTEMERGLTTPPPTTIKLPVPQKSEKTGAAVVHVADIFFPIVAPSIAWFVTRKKSDYIASHARQAIVEALWLKLFLGIAIAVSLTFTVLHVVELWQGGVENIDWWPEIWKAVLKFAISWILMTILGFINSIMSILQAVKAYQGEWPKSWVKRMAKMNR